MTDTLTFPVYEEEVLAQEMADFVEAFEAVSSGEVDTVNFNEIPEGEYECEVKSAGVVNMRARDGDVVNPKFRLRLKGEEWTTSNYLPTTMPKLIMIPVVQLVGQRAFNEVKVNMEALNSPNQQEALQAKADYLNALGKLIEGKKVIAKITKSPKDEKYNQLRLSAA